MHCHGSRDVAIYTEVSLFPATDNHISLLLNICDPLQSTSNTQQYTQEFERMMQLRIFTEDHRGYHRLLQTCHVSPSSASIGDPSVIDLAASWLTKCTTEDPNRKDCLKGSSESQFYPERLLDIRGDNVCLFLKDNMVSQKPYCALSYCWGKEPISPVLTASNSKDFRTSIDPENLPKTIRDAIHVTKQLGIDYLWVDCLCIIQQGDDGKVWEKHAGEMDKIF